MCPDHPLRLHAQTLATSDNANMAVCQMKMSAKKTFQTNKLDMILKSGDINFEDQYKPGHLVFSYLHIYVYNNIRGATVFNVCLQRIRNLQRRSHVFPNNCVPFFNWWLLKLSGRLNEHHALCFSIILLHSCCDCYASH